MRGFTPLDMVPPHAPPRLAPLETVGRKARQLAEVASRNGCRPRRAVGGVRLSAFYANQHIRLFGHRSWAQAAGSARPWSDDAVREERAGTGSQQRSVYGMPLHVHLWGCIMPYVIVLTGCGGLCGQQGVAVRVEEDCGGSSHALGT